jgi:hypothetical protein
MIPERSADIEPLDEVLDGLAQLVETIFPKGAAFRRTRLGSTPWIDAFALLEKHGRIFLNGGDYKWSES